MIAARHRFSSAIRTLRRARLVGFLGLAAALVATGCSDVGGPDDQTNRAANVAGSWSGSTIFGSNGFTTSVSLQQRDRAVTGEMTIAGAFRDAPLVGEIDDFNRFTWAVNRGCEVWSGVMTIEASQIEMAGPVLLDGSRCPVITTESATMQLDRAS
jgi:hypothetical protein